MQCGDKTSDEEIIEIEEIEEEEILTSDEFVDDVHQQHDQSEAPKPAETPKPADVLEAPKPADAATPKPADAAAAENTKLSASAWAGWRVLYFSAERAEKFVIPAQVRDPETYVTSVPSLPTVQSVLDMYFSLCTGPTAPDWRNPAGQEHESMHEVALDSADEGDPKKNIMKDCYL